MQQEQVYQQQDFKIKVQQLNFIINKLEKLHQANSEYVSMLKNSREYLNRKDIQNCAALTQVFQFLFYNKRGLFTTKNCHKI